jgi:cell division protein FtsN
MKRAVNPSRQGGGFAVGLVVGLLVGLALALGVALYITKVPVPFIDKVPQRSAAQEQAEAERLRQWDPNAPLGGRIAPRPAAPSASLPGGALPPGIAPAPGVVLPPAEPPPVAQPGTRDPAAILAGSTPATDAYLYFVQAGAYTRADEAEQQRARLALMGMESRITEREQSGRTVYRVRVGPYPDREQADALQMQLTQGGLEAQIVRVERP